MKTSLCAAAAWFVLLALVPGYRGGAQVEWQFSGYVLDLPVYQRVNPWFASFLRTEQDQALNITRVRLRPTLLLWDGARVTLEHEVVAWYHSTALPDYQTAAITRRQAVNLTWNTVEESRLTLRQFVDRLYFRQNFDFGSLVVGRQRISWGTGRIWNPTDLFNPINPASFDKIEKDGADAVSFKYYLGSFTDVEVVYNAEEKFKSWNAGFRFRTNFSEYDVSVVGGYFDKRYVAGGDFAGNLFEAGVRGEGIVSANKDDLGDSYVKCILGIDYQFTSKLYALAEYQYNGEGEKDKNRYRFLFDRLAQGAILNFARNYLFVQGLYQLHPLVMTGLGVNLNLDDGSGFIAPSVTWSSTENSELGLGGLLTYGAGETEYWYYPLAVYVKGQWYF